MLVFIHINKTGGRTIRYILRSSFGLRHCEVEPWRRTRKGQPFSTEDLQHVRKVYPRLESIGGHRVTGYAELQENGTAFRYFTFIRDPLKTCASRFQYNIQYRGKKDLVFEEWIQQDWTRNSQTKMIAGVADVDEAIRILQAKQIFVGLTERFDESLVLLKGLVAPDLNINYRRINVAPNNAIAKELLSTDLTRQMLIDANRADLDLYNYVKNELYPAFQAKYGPSLHTDVEEYQQTRVEHFNRLNLTLSRVKQYMIYKPLLRFYRSGVAL